MLHSTAYWRRQEGHQEVIWHAVAFHLRSELMLFLRHSLTRAGHRVQEGEQWQRAPRLLSETREAKLEPESTCLLSSATMLRSARARKADAGMMLLLCLVR
ncbi:unnamed protein product [Prorocentrum cordatum]|uniref:Uncharacterized protein n=1 Tax=Prorocentrum cordatum TaxID=2364126 RepID=A0ABN9XTC2_9DINO|nr:unnamed protein product [Polarella glacialis]